jgi:hypothetical protein
MLRLLQSKRTLFITLAASALVAAAASGAYAGTAAPAKSSPAGPAVYFGYHAAPITLPSTLRTIATLRVPAGNYIVFAKLSVWDGVNEADTLTCKLVAGKDFDTSVTVLTGNTAGYVNYAAMALNVVHHFSARGKINLQCTGGSIDTSANWIKISAIKAGSLSDTAIS